ncbi:DUF1376 domain-containing protein [Bartonella harrusi]|uniref:YdaU family protein n=1 Tax=Bartonella harrusi TaxID=2961895 RepID=A0ABY5ERT2_9HYPH|nr:DUF1376 domain-containing protein [Bartonella harrusi]UTO27819.1 YdaU family protein [Bartonella harrusi]UTO28729.1 YdaU family protein [Bartonella harrusi]
MANQLPWVRNFYQEWIMDFAGTDAAEKATYSTLTALMYRACEPIYDDTSALARIVGCSVQTFKKSLEKLIRKKLILQLEDGNLWSTQVEEELKNCNENLNRLSEKAIKAANTRKNKQKDNASKEYDASIMTSSQDHDDVIMTSSRQHINNNINSYNKKTNTIVLAKKEIDFEDLETNEQVDEPSEDHDCEKRADAIETVAEDQPLIHEQENVPKKAKRSQTNRGCRLPDDFEPNLQYAIDKGLTHDEALLEVERFRNFWQAKSGKDTTKSDWQKAWYSWITHPDYGLLAKKKEKLEREKRYGKPIIENTREQRGKSYRVAQYMSDIKNSDSAYKFLFEDDERTTIPLVTGTKTLDCRSGENYLISQ